MGLNQISTDRWMAKQNYCKQTMSYYSALKKNDILIHATTWMKLKDIMVREISQLQSTNTVWSYLYELTPSLKTKHSSDQGLVGGGFV